MQLSLEGKKAFVCGSTQGIGLAVAQAFAGAGAKVVLLARNEDKLREAVAGLKGSGHQFIVADFSDPDTLKKKVDEYVSGNGPVHILVNNTGGPPGGPVINAKVDEFTSAFRNHLVCNHILATSLLEGMKAAGYGRIINIISTSVKQPLHGLGVSNTIRAAVANWAKTWANETAKWNITVNNVLPGATNTSRLRSIIETKSGKTNKPVEETGNEMMNEIPMRRFAEPSEIANAVLFLASPAASYITGINLPVDGGRTGSL